MPFPVRFLLFKDEGHELAQPHNREIFVRVTVDWLLDVFEEHT